MKLCLSVGIKTWLTTLIILVFSSACHTAGVQSGIHLDVIKLPPGFKISVFADKLPDARSMVMSPDGILFVGTRKEGKIYAVTDRNGDQRADEVITIAERLTMPNGVAFRNGSLYIAEVHRILRYDNIENRIKNPPIPVVVNDTFPRDRHHGWKYIAFGPDDRLYIPVGAPCNVCVKEDGRYATIMRMQPDGSDLEIFSHGIRNTVGFDWHPETRELWFTNNGRDWMGDDLPPDTLHHAPLKGLDFGFPYCHAGDVPDPEFGKKYSCNEFSPTALKMQAHAATLGMKFYTGNMFPERYRHQIFVAEHGSWNRSMPVGYRITRIYLEGNRPIRYEVFADGWLQGTKAWGRPVDILILKDGSMLVSDDRAGAVYRITYNP
jgi:glucose/arabinose dehydrogenase